MMENNSHADDVVTRLVIAIQTSSWILNLFHIFHSWLPTIIQILSFAVLIIVNEPKITAFKRKYLKKLRKK
jgi:hypothetical protein